MNPPKFTNLTYTKNLGGSTGTQLYRNASNKKWVVKKGTKGGGYLQVATEALSNTLYKLCGIPVPDFYLDTENKALILEYIDGKLLSEATPEEFEVAKKELQKGFVMDALLANWDVIGLDMDNILLPSDGGPPVRIDNGGSMYFKATGGAKLFSHYYIPELKTMRDPKQNKTAAKIFGDLKEDEIYEKIQSILKPKKDILLQAIENPEVKDVIDKRINILLSMAEVSEPIHIPTTSAVINTPQVPLAPPMNIPAPTEMSIYEDKLEVNILKHFFPWYSLISHTVTNDALNLIQMMLINNEAVITGSFLLKAMGAISADLQDVDMDIYVPSKNVKTLTQGIRQLFIPCIEEYFSNKLNRYGEKHIRSITKMEQRKPKKVKLDIVEIDDSISPKDVVKGTDLTFCKNWYDGQTLYATFPQDIIKKEGFLDPKYIPLYNKNDKRLIQRLEKYMTRGFDIRLPGSGTPIYYSEVNTKLGKVPIKNIQANTHTEVNINVGKVPITTTQANTPSKLNSISSSIDNNIYTNSEGRLIQYGLQNLNTNILKKADFNIYRSNTIPLVDLKILPPYQKRLLNFYSINGFIQLNQYLFKGQSFKPTYFLNSFTDLNLIQYKFPINSTETTEDYQKRILYYYFVNIYNTIQKSPKVNTPFIVYRGYKKTSYLQKDKKKFYYMNSFSSTTTKYDQTSSFLNITGNVYLFLIHPMCKYINMSNISQYPEEKEILLTPYHRYIFIGSKMIIHSNNIFPVDTFAILPTDLTIPETYEEFDTWKNSIASMSSPHIGGKMAYTTALPLLNKKMNYSKATLKQFRNNKKMNTQKQNTTRKVEETSRKPNRFTDPIPSFAGKAPTKEEMEVIASMVKYMEAVEAKNMNNSKKVLENLSQD